MKYKKFTHYILNSKLEKKTKNHTLRYNYHLKSELMYRKS